MPNEDTVSTRYVQSRHISEATCARSMHETGSSDPGACGWSLKGIEWTLVPLRYPWDAWCLPDGGGCTRLSQPTVPYFSMDAGFLLWVSFSCLQLIFKN